MTVFIIDPEVLFYNMVFVSLISCATIYGWTTYQSYRRKEMAKQMISKITTLLWDSAWKATNLIIPSIDSMAMTGAIRNGFELLREVEKNSDSFVSKDLEKIIVDFQKDNVRGNVNYDGFLEKIFQNPEMQHKMSQLIADVIKN